MRAVLAIIGLSFLSGLISKGYGKCVPPYTVEDKVFGIKPGLLWYESVYDKDDVITIYCKDLTLDVYDTVTQKYSKQVDTECLGAGIWNPYVKDRYTCKKRDLGCPLKITDRNLIASTSAPFVARGKRVSFKCKSGYYLFGFSTIRCGSRGLFNAPIPQCKPFCTKPKKQPYLIITDDEDSYTTDGSITLSCEKGYRVYRRYEKVRYCTDDGTFDPPLEDKICQRTGCKPPGFPDYGSYTSERGDVDWYEIGDKITYKCNVNYYLEGKYFRVCTNADRFSYTAPVCIEVRCKAPMMIDNGSYEPEEKSYAVGESVVYTCKKNYMLSTESGSRTCTLNSDLKTASFPKEPRCIRIPCKNPDSIKYGSYEPAKGPYYITDFVEYTCDDGYYLDGNAKAVCLLNDDGNRGYFTKAPSCRPILCDEPMKPKFGDFAPKSVSKKYRLDAMVKFECEENYYMVGPATAKCVKDTPKKGKFTKSPICIEIRCKKPMEPANGDIKPDSKDYPVDATIMYSCNINYKLVPMNGKRTCTVNDDGKTASFGAGAKCVRIECDDPMDIDNGSFKPENQKAWYVGDSVIYECDRGYELMGASDSSTCKLNKDMVSASFTKAPYCKRVYCAYPGAPENGKTEEKKDKYVVDETIMFSCDRCYKLVGAMKATCQQNGKFSESVPTCQLLKCLKDDFPIPVHGSFKPIKPKYDCGETVEYICPEGYNRVGDETTECLPNGKFEIIKGVKCIPIVCRRPRLQSRGTISPSRRTYAYQTKVKYGCRSGYHIDKSYNYDTAICQANGVFSNPPPKCVPNKCGKPPIPKNGKIIDYDPSITEYEVGEDVLYECDEYYEFAAEDYNECGDNGWLFTPVCLPASCKNNCHLKYDEDRPCNCDGKCYDRGDCCNDVKKYCPPFSCGDRCNTAKSGYCSCKPSCVKSLFEKCCDDFLTVCPQWYT